LLNLSYKQAVLAKFDNHIKAVKAFAKKLSKKLRTLY